MKLLFKLIIGLFFSLNALAQCDFSILPTEAGSGCIATNESVVFTNLQGAAANGNRIVKTANGNGWNAGGSSTSRVYNGGSAQTIIDQTNRERLFGLSEFESGVNPNTIQFAFRLRNGGNLRITESGNDRGNFGSYANGDVLSIELVNGVVQYLKNDIVLYVSNATPAPSMLIDISLRNSGSRLNDVSIHNKSSNQFSAALSGNPGWYTALFWTLDGQAIGNGNVQIAVNDFQEGSVLTCTLLSFGGDCGFLTTSNEIVLNTVSSFSATDFYISTVSQNPGCFVGEEQVVWDLAETQNITVNANSLEKVQVGNIWNAGSASANSVDDNGAFRFTAEESNTEKMIGLSSNSSNGNQNAIQYAFYLRQNGVIRIREQGNDRGNFGSYQAGDEFKLAIDGGVVNYYKNNNLLFISPNTPSLPLLADVAINYEGTRITEAYISNTTGGKFYAQFQNAGDNPNFEWYVNGSAVGENSNTLIYNPSHGDIISCAIEPDLGTCEDASFTSTSIAVSTSENLSNADFHISAVPDLTSPNLATEEVAWNKSSLSNVEATESAIEKIQLNGLWNGNAASLNTVKNGGYLEFNAAQVNKACAVGLSNSDQSDHYNSIDFAFYLESNGNLRIIESGADRGNFGTYNTGTTFKIIADDGEIKYFKNGALMYSSNIAPTLPLHVDASIKDEGGRIENVSITHPSTGEFTAFYTGSDQNPIFSWKLNGTDVGDNSPFYINGSMYQNDVVTCEITPDAQGCTGMGFESNQIRFKNDEQATDWLGAVSEDWNDALNWSAGVPGQTISARIIANRPFEPVVNTAAEVKDLQIQSGAEVTIDQTFAIQIFGDIANEGVLNTGSGVITFAGEGSRTVSGNPIEFNRLIMNLTNPADSLIMEMEGRIKDETMLLSGVIYTGSNELVYLESADSRQGSASSYVDGTCRKIGNREFVFPVGKNGVYAPIGMSAPTETDAAFTARYYDENPGEAGYAVAEQDGTMNNISTCEYWIFNRVSGNSAVAVALSYETERSCGVNDPTGLCVARWDGAAWENHGYSYHDGNADAGNVTSAGPIQNFSPFTLGSTTVINPLPIELLDFDVKKVGSLVKVDWATSTETNNDYFTVERSTDGANFSAIGTIAGSGNSHSEIHYDFIDKNPVKGTSYYRLRQTDFDGKTEVFDVKSVSFSASSSAIVYPNPNSGSFSIKVNGDSEKKDWFLYNAAGHQVWASKEEQSDIRVELPNPVPGLYVLFGVNAIGETTSEKIIIK